MTLRAAAVAWVLAVAGGCGSRSSAPPPEPVDEPTELPPPVIPREPGAFEPALIELAGQAARFGDTLADVATCSSCHPDAFAQQQASAHAFSSFNNPIYRASIEPMREAVGNRPSRMCGGCHDISLLVDGALDGEVSPRDRRAHSGVTCRTCHGIDAAARDGNGSYTLSGQEILIPDMQDAASVDAHRQSAAPLRTAEMCGSCHRAFLSEATGNAHFLSGQDELGAWLGSPYNASGLSRVDVAIEKQTCIGCHMQREPAPLGDRAARDGTIASHRFLGGHTWLAQMHGDDQQLARQQSFLRGVASIDIAAARDDRGSLTLPADGAPVAAGRRLTLDVVVRNLLVGHRFPGGVLDAQDTWVELTVQDARGRTLAASGFDHARGRAEPAHVLRALIAGDDGAVRLERETHQFSAVIANYTIAARDMMAVRYVWRVPDELTARALPVRVRARLLHRSRNLKLQAAACRSARSARGREFAAHARKLGDPVLDPCAAQPITVVAEAVVWLGDGAPARDRPPARAAWSRLYEHGMALLYALQEQASEARPSLDAALAQLGVGPGVDRERAMVLAALARLEARLGRTDQSIALIARARQLIGPHPALAKLEGDALAAVWRWDQAAAALAPAVDRARDNADGWRAYAIALGSLSRDRDALAAAQAGLALAPRNGDLLRVQAVALRSLGAPEALAALEAYDRYRDPDVANDLRFRGDVGPVPVIDLTPVR